MMSDSNSGNIAYTPVKEKEANKVGHKKAASNYTITIIESECQSESLKKKEPFYFEDTRPRTPVRHKSTNAVASLNRMSSKELILDAHITGKLRSNVNFDNLIADPLFEKLISKK